MKKIVCATLAVVALSVPAFAQDTLQATGNNNTSIAQDNAVAVTAGVALDGGVLNTGGGAVSKTDTSVEAERGGVANTSTGIVTKESGNASAEADRGGIVADGTVTTRSGNTSTEAERGGIVSSGAVTSESGNASDGSIVAAGPVNANRAEEGGIAATGKVKATSIDDSFNKEELEITVGDVLVLVSNGDLNGTVSNNSIDAATSSATTTGNIENRGSAFSGVTGITVVKSNTGFNSSMQTSINVNANVSK